MKQPTTRLIINNRCFDVYKIEKIVKHKRIISPPPVLSIFPGLSDPCKHIIEDTIDTMYQAKLVNINENEMRFLYSMKNSFCLFSSEGHDTFEGRIDNISNEAARGSLFSEYIVLTYVSKDFRKVEIYQK